VTEHEGSTFRGSGIYRATALALELLPPNWKVRAVECGPSLCLMDMKVVWLHGKATEFEATEDALHEVAHAWMPDGEPGSDVFLDSRLHRRAFFEQLTLVYQRAFAAAVPLP